MKINNIPSQINFSSKIKLIDQNTFDEKIKNYNPKRHEVGYPWIPEVIKTGKNMYTTNIQDCISGGIVQKGKVRFFHICTYHQHHAKEKHQKGFNIEKIERRLLEKIDLNDENVHAFILGGFQLSENSKYNVYQMNKIKNIFEKHQIPYSIIGARRDVHYFGKYSIFYNNKEDTFYIANSLTNATCLNGKGKELVIDGDKVIFHTYKKVMDPGWGVSYPRTREVGTAEDFFKSQFRQVSLCKFDRFA